MTTLERMRDDLKCVIGKELVNLEGQMENSYRTTCHQLSSKLKKATTNIENIRQEVAVGKNLSILLRSAYDQCSGSRVKLSTFDSKTTWEMYSVQFHIIALTDKLT